MARRAKKSEGEKRKSPTPPIREKGKGKEKKKKDKRQPGFLKKPSFARAGARATARLVAKALDEDLDTAVRAFGGTAEDRRIWASIAWRAGAEEFHYAVLDKIAEDRADGPACNPAAAFQAFLNHRFPKEGGAR